MRLGVLVAVLAVGVGLFLHTVPAVAADDKVVIYTSIDAQYARALMKKFEQKTGVRVELVTDGEGVKTAGLAEKVEAEKSNPKADVYWGNEIFHTINLANKGAFAPYRSPLAADIADRWKDKDGLYVDVGLRIRVIGVSTRPQDQALASKVKSIEDLTDPSLKGRIAVCHPAFGTAAGHFASLYVVLGEEKYRKLLHDLKANDIKILGGNGMVVRQVCAGSIIAGPTDNDDVANAIADGGKVATVVPNQDSYGTLVVPTSIALVKGAPNPETGKKLIDFLLDPVIEEELIAGRFLAFSTRTAQPKVRGMDVDYAQAAREMRKAVEIALNILQDRK